MRIAIVIQYNGSIYNGFQSQPNKNTIQDYLEKALSKIANEKITVICAGRTDAKVHARMQVCHFDTNVNRTMYSWHMGTNGLLPKDIRVMSVYKVSNNFHARFDVTARDYKYLIYNNKVLSPSLNKVVYHCYKDLNIRNMQKAANYYIGQHDFSSIRDSQCQSKTPIRIINDIKIYKKDDFIITHIKGTAFLHHMIRNLMGVLVDVGTGFKDVSWAHKVLLAKDRKKASKTLEADGLYFYKISYNDFTPNLTWHFLDFLSDES